MFFLLCLFPCSLSNQAKTKGFYTKSDIGVKYAAKKQRKFNPDKMKAGDSIISQQVTWQTLDIRCINEKCQCNRKTEKHDMHLYRYGNESKQSSRVCKWPTLNYTCIWFECKTQSLFLVATLWQFKNKCYCLKVWE